MAERIVVSLHLRGAAASGSGYQRRAFAARRRAEVLGALLAAWGPESFAFDFAAEEVEEAVDLARATFDDPAGLEPRFSAGVAFGDLERLGGPGASAMLAWGEPLVVAWKLAMSALPGEVLIDERCPSHLSEGLRMQGERRLELGPEGLTALVLDARHPFRRDTLIDALGDADSKVRVTVPPLPPLQSLSRELRERVTGPPATQPRPRKGRPSEPPPTERTAPPSSVPVSSVPVSSVSSVPASSVPGAGRISWPGASEEYIQLTTAARQALLKGNVSELARLSDELKSHGEADLADRMAAFVAWNRGAKAEGLRKLRVAADAEGRPAHRVRALLAYGVALAASGRTDASLLAALGALARAREVSDRHGEHVCARFLARLSAASGYERAARAWATVAAELVAPRSA